MEAKSFSHDGGTVMRVERRKRNGAMGHVGLGSLGLGSRDLKQEFVGPGL